MLLFAGVCLMVGQFTGQLTLSELEAIPLVPPRTGKSVTKKLFDGATLNGWHVGERGNPEWWSVGAGEAQGAIRGKASEKVPTSFLLT